MPDDPEPRPFAPDPDEPVSLTVDFQSVHAVDGGRVEVEGEAGAFGVDRLLEAVEELEDEVDEEEE